ncbi:hypothetical protein LQE92_08930 [Lacrimispora sp. NSJ-141]|uniref:Uncharacterized protein n=1 Tax=Lientehia hominis TaxID=2897778 RepID=A0AAP2RJ18_9FIRM|nr:hypothetical protein [Lientehia hominis]MCD2492751.1 hypothetical protein [Lientehia hominis]
MNYIAEMKAFYDRLELNPQPAPVIALWHALMSIANKAGWPDMFTVASSVLGLRAGLNAQAIKRARNQLAQNGYISWQPRGGNLSAMYHIQSLVVQNDTKNVPQSEPQVVPQSGPQSEPQVVPQSVPINKHKLKQIQKKDSNESKEKFTPPTVDEVRAYCVSRGNKINPDTFVNFYSSKGWMVGKNKMKDWKACVRTWEQTEKEKNRPGKKNVFSGYDSQRDYDADALVDQINGMGG